MVPATANGAHYHPGSNGYVNGAQDAPHANGYDVPIEALEAELPVVEEGLMSLGDLVSRVVQACYAELTDMAETFPTDSDGQASSDNRRKIKMATFALKWKKQVVKLYAVAKWARDAHIVQKCMNITAFLLGQSMQFRMVVDALSAAKEELSAARVRNHDLLTSLDVLTTGTYRRLPTDIRKRVLPPRPLSDEEVARTLTRIEAAIRYRLRMDEIVPVEMSKYRIEDGRAFFTVSGLFEVSLCLLGMEQTDSWFFTDVEFLFNVGGQLVRGDELPKKPTGPMLQWISDESDTRLGFYSSEQPTPPPPIPGQPEPPRNPRLEEGIVDAPLVRLFNFLQAMSMSYQLEILWMQAERLRFLGWAEYLSVRMSEDRRTLTLTYWLRTPPPNQSTARQPPKIPLHGGMLTIALVASSEPLREPKASVLAELQARARLNGRQLSDTVESLRWEVRWEPQPGAIGIRILDADAVIREGELRVDPTNLDVEKLLRAAIQKHIRGFFNVFIGQIQHGVLALRDAVSLTTDADGSISLRTMLCADEIVFTAIDPRTGRVKLWDTGDLGAAGRGPRFTVLTERVNENPGALLLRALVQLRLNTIIDLAQQKAHYLGLQTYKMRNFQDFTKFGRSARGQLYIQLAPYPSHYLVLVVTDNDFRYALISASEEVGSMYNHLVMKDIGWLDVGRICTRPADEESAGLGKRKRESGADVDSKFKLETNVLRELYAYCCARVAHMKVELQFKQHSIPYKHVFPSTGLAALPSSVAQVHSALSAHIPSLCVQSADIIKEDMALDAAMPNIRVVPLAWWAGARGGGNDAAEDRPPQVVTCVRLKYVQQPVGRRAGASTGVIRPSRRIVYDAREAIVSFLADEVEGCVDLFVKEWNSVSKIVAIAREVAQMAKKWSDVRLLSFDLQTVEFAYAADFVVSVACDDPTNPSAGSFHLHFSRLPPSTPATATSPSTSTSTALIPASQRRSYNPHSDAEPFFLHLLRNNPLSVLPFLVNVLRNTVPIVEVLEEIRAQGERAMDIDSPPFATSSSNFASPPSSSQSYTWSWADVDTYPKSAGWWRTSFGPGARHALDFRLMQGPRIAILDASYALQPPSQTQAQAQLQYADSALLLKPIPRMNEIVTRAAGEARRRGRVAVVGVGVVCEVRDAAALGRAVWAGVLREFVVGVGGAAAGYDRKER